MIAGLSLTFKPQGSSTWCAHGEGGTTSKDLILWFDQSKTAKLQNSRTLHWPFFLFFQICWKWQFFSKELRWANSWAPGPFTTVTVRRVLIEMCISFVIQCHLAAKRSQFRFRKTKRSQFITWNEVNLLCFENTLVTELYGLRGWDMGIWWCLVKRVV